MISRYRLREATEVIGFQWTGENFDDLVSFCGFDFGFTWRGKERLVLFDVDGVDPTCYIGTGSYVFRDISGDKAVIVTPTMFMDAGDFEAKYEECDSSPEKSRRLRSPWAT